MKLFVFYRLAAEARTLLTDVYISTAQFLTTSKGVVRREQ